MKYAYYVTDTASGEILGTDSESIAKSYAESEDYFVVHAASGEWLMPDGDHAPVRKLMG